jgi:hypothetical protein
VSERKRKENIVENNVLKGEKKNVERNKMKERMG